MAQRLEQSVIRILNPQGITLGAGFVVDKRLAVTCSHLVKASGSNPGEQIQVEFFADSSKRTVQVMREGWSAHDAVEDANDVALLNLGSLPEGIVPVVLGSPDSCANHPYSALGFPSLADYDVRWVQDRLILQ